MSATATTGRYLVVGAAAADQPAARPMTYVESAPDRAAVALFAFAAATTCQRAFAGYDLTALIGVMAVLPALAVPSVAGLGRPWQRLATQVGLYALGATVLVFALSRPAGWPFAAGGDWQSLAEALARGPGFARLSRLGLPVPAVPALSLVPAALTWWAATAGTELAVRRPGALESLLPAAVCAGYGLLLGGPGLGWPAIGAGAVCGLVLILRARAGTTTNPSARRKVPRGLSAVALIVAGVAVPGAAGWTYDRFGPMPAAFPVGLLAAAVLVALAGLVVALVLAALAVVRRWRRRTAGSPGDRVIGAWHDVLDELAADRTAPVDLTPVTPLSTRALVEARLGTGDAVVLYSLASQALFSDRPLGTDEVRQAWQDAARIRRALRRRLPARRRLWRRLGLSPRPGRARGRSSPSPRA